MDLNTASFKEIATAVKTKKASALEVTQHFLKRAKSLDGKLNSYITFNDKAEDEDKALDGRIAKGEDVGIMAGVPFGIKDMFCTRGLKTTAASKILENFVPPYDATVVERLRKAGITVLGKLNQDEFAMGSSNENSHFGPVKNPWNVQYVPGGSSGGSAAAVAAVGAGGKILVVHA